jgi:membrane protein implicated in regulation of membrane protease activity
MEIDKPAELFYNYLRLTTDTYREGLIMGNGLVEVTFFDSWAWLIFIGAGLVLVLLELIVGVETGLDLVFIGSAFILSGLITIAMHTWVWTALIAGIICIIYLFLGRRYIHKRMSFAAEKTNIDTIIGKKGVVLQDITRHDYGLVKVGMEQWRAGSEEEIKEGEEVTVIGISGVTLTVKKEEGGNQ